MKNTLKISLLVLVILNLYETSNAQLVTQKYLDNWADPEIQYRIENGIETYRKDWAELIFLDEKGEETEFSGNVEIRQISHDFLFGANIFMLEGYDEDWKNKKYESIFKELLNFATVPFYWAHLEREKGNPRYERGSQEIYRRPPPDIVVEFCKENHIAMKGHPIFWDNPEHGIPDWLPTNNDSMEYYLRKRVESIGKRYKDDIMYWDVVNESNNRHPGRPAPKDFPSFTFELAEKYLGYESSFAYNFTTAMWRDYMEEYSLEYLLIENLLLKGGKVDAIGLQCHFMGKGKWNSVITGEAYTPQQLFQIMDLYGQFNLPLQVTEITFPTFPYNKTGEETQARVTRDFYRLWFSHPAMSAITWWNVSDGTATQNEDRFNGGFLREDMSPKPAYDVLNDLINKEWRTRISESIEKKSHYKFRGFYGRYEIVLKKNGKVAARKSFHLHKDRTNEFVFKLK